MPKALGGRSFREVPLPSKTNKKNRMKQLEYDSYLTILNEHEVGELELSPGDSSRSVRVSLRKAAHRAGFELDTWEANGHVFFRKAIGVKPKKGRAKSMLDIRRAEGQGLLDGESEDEDEDDEEDDDEEEEVEV